jgi:hypothetical protein
MKFWDALKALRDVAIAKRAAKLVALADDNTQPVIVAKTKGEVIPLKPRKVKQPEPTPEPPPVSMPLVITAAWHTAHNIADEFDGDMRFDDAATRQWRQDQQKTTWRDSNSSLPRKAT